MAVAARPKFSMEIRTKSVEQTLVPLVTQITTLVNHRDRALKSERTLKALIKVGQSVNGAVDKFVTVGESIAEDNEDIRVDMCEACREARLAGQNIQKMTDIRLEDTGTPIRGAEKASMVRAARQLLSAVTKVLLLADRVVVKQLLAQRSKVLSSLAKLEVTTDFGEFVRGFTKFGSEMVEFAHLTGDRQNDLKSDKQRCEMSVARTVLEKNTVMLLTTCKTYLRHSDCDSARSNRDGVFSQMRFALDLIQRIVMDQPSQNGGDVSPTMVNGDSGIGLAQQCRSQSAVKCLKEFTDLVEVTRVTLIAPQTHARLATALEQFSETTQDFTDSAYTSHEHRERILQLCERLRGEMNNLIRIGQTLEDKESLSPSKDLETAIIQTIDVAKMIKKLLQEVCMTQASDLFSHNEDRDLLASLKHAGVQGLPPSVDEISVKFQEHAEQLQEVAKLLRHIASTDTLVITADHVENTIRALAPQMILAAKTLSQYPGSKIARENLDTYSDNWQNLINEISVLVKEVNDHMSGRVDRQVYMSLPRPGKHGSHAKSLRPGASVLEPQEQAKIAKLGLEMKLITSEMDAETDKWEDANNDIVKRAKNMSSMAFSLYLFTRGEGPLKTTQDLFTQAQYFAEEGTKLFKTVKEFSAKVPAGSLKTELMTYLDKIPAYCQHLQFTLKSPTFGKTATFNKVDSAIQETKNLMNAIAKVVTTCFMCATKFNIDYRSSSHSSGSSASTTPSRWRPQAARSHSLDQEHVSQGQEYGSPSARGQAPDYIQRSTSLGRGATGLHGGYHEL